MSNEVRDWLAGLEGWTTYMASNGVVVWERGSIDDGTYETRTTHPIPDDLTTCAAMWDEYAGEHGWEWWRLRSWYTACSTTSTGELDRQVTADKTGHDAASELRDRWALLGEVLKARGVW